MKVALCFIAVICSLCRVDTIKVKDSRQSEPLSFGKTSKGLRESTTTYAINKADDGFEDSLPGIKFSRIISPRFGNSWLNVIGSQISRESSDFEYPTIYDVENVDKGIASPYEELSFERGDEDLEYNKNMVNFPKDSITEAKRKDINLLEDDSGVYRLGISDSESYNPSGELRVDADSELYGPRVIHSEGTRRSESDVIASDKDYHKSSASNFEANRKAASGKEGSKVYKTAASFDKGDEKSREKGQHREHYDISGGKKKGFDHENEKYADKEAAALEKKSESFSNSAGRQKGHKTSGFHNVYHKDEYKKDTSFYDSSHEEEARKADGSEDSRHAEVKGAHEKKEEVDASYHEDEHGKKKLFTNGHQYGLARGHSKQEEENETYENEAKYDKDEKHQLEREKIADTSFEKTLLR